MSTKGPSILVAAIDFGTAYSGYAFSFRTEYEKNPCQIFAKTSWDGGAALSEKTLTCVLFDEKRKFHSYGYPAEDMYADLALRGEHKKWLFFKRFKMKLYGSQVRRDMFLEAEGGQKMAAMTVFGESLAHLRQKLLEELERQGSGVAPADIHCVLTVRQCGRTCFSEAEGGQKMEAMTVFGESLAHLRQQLLEELERRGSGVAPADIHWVLTVRRDMFLEAEGGQKMEAMTVFGESLAHLRQQLLEELERQGSGLAPADIYWVRRDMFLEAEGGQKMEAMTVFGESLAHLRQQLLEELERQGSGVAPADIHWVLTVPAIWSDGAKQFMREAAAYAEIKPHQLTIALEPEAASLYCQMISSDKVRGAAGARQDIAKPGTKFMVIDLGGGTADITVHMKQEDGTLRELYRPTGGCWGGTEVDAEFERALIKLVGAPTYREFCLERKDDHILLQRDFETAKRRMKASTKDKMILRVPISLADGYKKREGEDITKGLARSLYKSTVEWVRDKLIVDAEVLHSFFKTCSQNVVKYLKQVMAAPEVKGTNIFLMVGGFAECDIMQNAISTAFPGVKLVIPEDSSLAVVKGAVIYGHQPIRISTRVTKYTYGVNISPEFDPKIHPGDHKVEVGGQARCRDVFKEYVKLGTKMDVGEAVKYKHVSLKSKQRQMQLKLFASEDASPRFTDEEGVRYLGKLVVNLPADTDDDKITVQVALIFGETELRLEAKEMSTGTKYSAFFDFL